MKTNSHQTLWFVMGIRGTLMVMILLATGWFNAFGQATGQVFNEPQIIPRPLVVMPEAGAFSLDATVPIQFSSKHHDIGQSVQQFIDRLGKASGIFLRKNHRSVSGRQIKLVLVKKQSADTFMAHHDASYFLTVNSTEIRISAMQPIGLHYGLQTLWQLLPSSIEKGLHKHPSYPIGAIRIMDSPRFKWRGMHLDVARHFFTPAEVKKFIDYLSWYKFNYFHWHLTDDQGWRIEIKRYPKLTAFGSIRRETMIGHTKHKPVKFDGKPHTGYYSHEEIREIVAYAKSRYVTIVPEIEMPGHAQAAVAAYPELGCAPDTPNVMRKWGISPYLFNVEESTFKFIEHTLDEVISLFPNSPYIHIGGDEAIKQQWRRSPRIQAKIRSLGLADEDELQSYFIKRVAKFINQRGRKLIGWDEIIDGGLAPGATVMSWRGIDGGRTAAINGHDAIMCPMAYCYFDFYQHDVNDEPLCIGGMTPLKKVYSFEPIPADLPASAHKYIIGLQANVWTEYIKNFERVQQQIFPRMFAISEIGWSARHRLDWTSFRQRVNDHAIRLEHKRIVYGHLPTE